MVAGMGGWWCGGWGGGGTLKGGGGGGGGGGLMGLFFTYVMLACQVGRFLFLLFDVCVLCY